MTAPMFSMSFYDQPGGRTYYGNIANSNIAIIVPTGYVPSGKVIIHFHGLRVASWDADKPGKPKGFGTIDFFEFHKYLRPDTLMVCPVAAKQGYSLAKSHSSVRQLIPMLNVISQTTKESYTDVTLSGHSAAGTVLKSLLEGGTGALPVKRCWLFDCTYSRDVSPYTEWLSKPGRILRSVARKNDMVLAHSLDIVAGSGSTANIRASQEKDHWLLVKKYFPIFLDAP